MSSDDSIPFFYTFHPDLLMERLNRPRCVGYLSFEQGQDKQMRLVVGDAGTLEKGKVLKVYWLVDETDGVIADAKFQGFGPPDFLVFADVASELVIGKTYEQAKRLGAELIEKAFHKGCKIPLERITLILDAFGIAVEKCEELLLPQAIISPIPREVAGSETGYPGWVSFSKERKIAILEDVLTEEVRPYIELDDGGIEILDLINENEVMISYSGNCTSCFSSVGTTLSTIQEIIRSKIHSELVVIPNMDNLKFSLSFPE